MLEHAATEHAIAEKIILTVRAIVLLSVATVSAMRRREKTALTVRAIVLLFAAMEFAALASQAPVLQIARRFLAAPARTTAPQRGCILVTEDPAAAVPMDQDVMVRVRARIKKDVESDLRDSKSYAEAYNNRGNAYNGRGNYRQAIDDLNRAIEIKPNFTMAYYNRGIVYHGLGNYRQAIEDFDRAIEIRPGHAYSYNNRALVYLIQGDNISGCRDAQKACELGNCKLLEAAKTRGLCRLFYMKIPLNPPLEKGEEAYSHLSFPLW